MTNLLWSLAIITIDKNVLTIHHASAVSIPMSGVVNGPLSEISGLLNTKVIAIAAVQDTISIRRSRSNTEYVVGQPCTISVNIVQPGALM